MRRLLTVILSTIFSSFLFASDALPVRIVSDVWPPFVIDDPNNPGVDVEVMEAVFAEMDVPIQFEIFPWQRAVSMVQSGKAEAILDIFLTEERLSTLRFPQTPISSTSTALFCFLCDPDQQVTEQDLTDKSLIVNRGYQYSSFGNNPEIARTAVDTFEQGFTMLRNERADYYLVNRQVGLYTVAQMNVNGMVALKQRIEDPSEVYLAFAKRPELLEIAEQFDVVLNEFLQSEKYQSILLKYGL